MDVSTLALRHGPSPAGGQPQHTGHGSLARATASGGCAWARRRVARGPGSGGKCRSAAASGTAATMAGDDGGDGSSRRSRKRTERANYSSFEVQGSTSSDSWSTSSVSSSSSAGSSNSASSASNTSTSTIADSDSSAMERRNSSSSSSSSGRRRSSGGDDKVRNLDRLQRKWRDTVQKQQEMRKRASEVEKHYNLDDDSASAAAKDWEDVEDPRKTNSMRARSLRISAKLRESLARRRRRPTSAPEGKEKRKLMVRFADQVTVRSYEVPQEEEEDVEGGQQDDAASYSLNGEMVLGGPKSLGMSCGHAMMAQQACIVDGDGFGSVITDETCALSDRARDLSKKQRRRSKRRNKNSKRVRSPEYTREAEFFDMIQDWCRRELTDVSYEGASIQEFLPRKRASAACDHHIETYAELVRKCKRFVDNEIYEPSSLEQDSSTFAIHTEEIIASLVRDCLESFLSYRVDKIPREADALCHDCFYIARDLVLARRALLDNTLTSTQA